MRGYFLRCTDPTRFNSVKTMLVCGLCSKMGVDFLDTLESPSMLWHSVSCQHRDMGQFQILE